MPITDYYVTTDAMGSVMAVLDESGNVLERRSYDAFGEVTYMLPDGTVVPNSPTGVDIGFQGQLMDELTGMYQMGYRWYSPVLGRWVSRDPIGLEGGVNPMAFVENQPSMKTDSSGLFSTQSIFGSLREVVSQAFAINKDNLLPLPLYLNDPSVSCLNEGWFRHCSNSCILQTQLNLVTSVSLPPTFTVLANSIVVQAVAITAGNDWPLQTGNDIGDIEANSTGILFALINGPSVSCIATCKELFHAKRNAECCASKPHLKKDDPGCC